MKWVKMKWKKSGSIPCVTAEEESDVVADLANLTNFCLKSMKVNGRASFFMFSD